MVFHSRVGVAHVGSGGAGPHGGRVDGAVVEVRAVAGLAAAAGVVWVVCAKGAACFVHTFADLYNTVDVSDVRCAMCRASQRVRVRA